MTFERGRYFAKPYRAMWFVYDRGDMDRIIATCNNGDDAKDIATAMNRPQAALASEEEIAERLIQFCEKKRDNMPNDEIKYPLYTGARRAYQSVIDEIKQRRKKTG